MLEHQHAISGDDRDRAAGHALAGDDRDIGNAERQARIGGAPNRFRLSALFGADAGIGAGGIDDREYGNAESIGHFHQPHGLAIAFRSRPHEIVLDWGFGGGPFFLPDHADALAAKAAEAAHQRLVLS